MAATKKSTKAVTQKPETGRRKSSVARVRLVAGNGKITINGRDIEQYFGLGTLKQIVRQPLELTNNLDKYDVFVNVYGGGLSGQVVALDENQKAVLKTAGLLTRDPRMKERKKYGLHKARKAVQFNKR